MRTQHLTPLAAAVALMATLAALLASAAFAAPDTDRAIRSLKAAYEHTEGDEGGFDGTLVEQCRTEGTSTVRCVVSEASGQAIDLPSGNYVRHHRPVDWAVATFDADHRITIAREPFAEAPQKLDADIRVARRLRPTATGRLVVRVSPDVASSVTLSGRFGRREIANRGPAPTRTVEVAGGRTTAIALRIGAAQRARVRKALRRTGSIEALISVRVDGDVGPAVEMEHRLAAVRVVR